FAPSWKRSAVGAFVLVHRLHELDFVVGVIAFASCRIDLSAAFAALAAFRAASSIHGNGYDLLAAISVGPALSLPAILGDNVGQRSLVVGHGRSSSLRCNDVRISELDSCIESGRNESH